jgi:hypothetical protein
MQLVCDAQYLAEQACDLVIIAVLIMRLSSSDPRSTSCLVNSVCTSRPSPSYAVACTMLPSRRRYVAPHWTDARNSQPRTSHVRTRSHVPTDKKLSPRSAFRLPRNQDRVVILIPAQQIYNPTACEPAYISNSNDSQR